MMREKRVGSFLCHTCFENTVSLELLGVIIVSMCPENEMNSRENKSILFDCFTKALI
jgi:hypothetical protein